MNKLLFSAGATLVSAGIAAGAYQLDREVWDGVTDQTNECRTTFEGEEQKDCIETVEDNAETYQLIQVAEILGLIGMGGFGYRTFKELQGED
jgi:hypothetical protein